MNKLRLASKLSRMLVAPITVLGSIMAFGLPTSASLSSIPAAYTSPPVVGFGSAPSISADQQVVPTSLVVGMAVTPDGKGYWLATATGQVFCYGDAHNFGSAAGYSLYGPIVGIASTPDGAGYWLVGSDGGVFTFGDAAFYGSMGGKKLNGPIVGIASTPNGKGYWLVATDGGVFTFGDATFYGSMGGKYLAGAIVGMAAFPGGNGYWLVGADGGVFSFGRAIFYGSMGGKEPVTPISTIVAAPTGRGYYLLSPDSFDYRFQPNPGERTTARSSAIVAAAESQIAPTSSPGSFCNPYGPCVEWCSLFASWVWNQAGIGAPADSFTGSLFDWTAKNQRVLTANDIPAEGDYVFYGTGPRSASTSVHMGIVIQAWGDGSLVTIEGDSGPGEDGYLGVTVNGPFLVSHSLEYNGAPIYGYGEPVA